MDLLVSSMSRSIQKVGRKVTTTINRTAAFVEKIALLQLRKGLHFFREHPDPSTLDEEFPWDLVIEELKSKDQLYKVVWGVMLEMRLAQNVWMG